jgi:hypothetical protein
MAIITSRGAQRIADEILSTHGEILAISIIDEKGGNILASKSSESFKKAFGVTREAGKYGGTLAIASLAVANEVKEVAGEARTLITIYEKCKMMLLRLSSYEILVGLVIPCSVNAEDYNIEDNLEGLLSDIYKQQKQ